MPLHKLDTTLNEDTGRQFSKLNQMLEELYDADSTTPNPSVTTLTASGAVSAGGLLTGATAKVGTGTKTATAVGGAATLNKASGVITTESLTTAQNALYTLTLTNSAIAAADIVMASLANGDNTQGSPMIEKVTPGDGSLVITVRNRHASAEALNGTLKIAFVSFKV